MENFRRLSTIFSTIFWKISTIFLEFSAIFLENFPKIFCNFFRLLRFPYDFSENSCPQSITVQPGSRHYCKFTSKFTSRITPKFTLILIKILQSTKFEGSHFFNSLSTFSTLCRLPKPFRFFALLSLRRRVFLTVAPPFQRHQRPSLPLRWRRYVGNTRDYK